jgi:hypothetical protein
VVAKCLPPESVAGSTPKAPATQSHPYNDPSLGPLAFLRAVMHDPSASLHHRMRAADILMSIGQGHIGVEREPEVTIHIGGIKGMH